MALDGGVWQGRGAVVEHIVLRRTRRSQLFAQDGEKGQLPVACLGLGVADLRGSVADVDGCLANGDDAALEVDVLPAQGDRLAAAQACVEHEQGEDAVLVVRGRRR